MIFPDDTKQLLLYYFNISSVFKCAQIKKSIKIFCIVKDFLKNKVNNNNNKR